MTLELAVYNVNGRSDVMAFDLVNAGIFVWLENFYAVDGEPSDKELPLVFFCRKFPGVRR